MSGERVYAKTFKLNSGRKKVKDEKKNESRNQAQHEKLEKKACTLKEKRVK